MPHQLQALGLRLHYVVVTHSLEQRLHGDRHLVDFDDAGIEARDVEQSAEETSHRAHRIIDVIQQAACFLVHASWTHGGDEQAQGVHRLPQVVAGCREKA